MEETVPAINTTPIPPQSFDYAGFGRRLLAYIVDCGTIFIFSMLVAGVFNQPLIPKGYFDVESLEELQALEANSSSGMLTGIMFFFTLIYQMIFWVNYDGATPGKRIMGIKIIKDDGAKLNYATAFIRYISTFISSFFLGLGYLWVIWDKKKQAWHDKIAKTYVIKTGAKPKTLLAFISSFLIISFMVLYFTLVFYKMVDLVVKDLKKMDTVKEFNQARSQNETAMSAQAKTHYEKANALFDDLRANQDNPEKLTLIADKAITELEQAVKLEPKNALLWELLGSAYTWPDTLGNEESALKAFQQAEKLDPQNVLYINGVGDELIKLGRNEDAILQFQKTLRITDESGYAHLSLGVAYKNLGINDSARTHFKKAIARFKETNNKGQFDDEILEAQKLMAEISQ